MYYIETGSMDPCFNLAFEEYVFSRRQDLDSCILLWQNTAAVIIGRNQNAYAEADDAYLRAHGIPLVRRMTGGGAVYHDPGNLNYSLIGPAGGSGEMDFAAFCGPVLSALKDLGLEAELSGRNDLLIGGRKISGSAQYIRGGRVLHHGTLLFDADLAVMDAVLRPDPAKHHPSGGGGDGAFDGIPSVRSRVANIRPLLSQDMTMAGFKEALKAALCRYYTGEDQGRTWIPCSLPPSDIAQIRRLAAEKYAGEAWNRGESPPFELQRKGRIPGCGSLEITMSTEQGRIRRMRVTGDYFGSPEAIITALEGCPLQQKALQERLQGLEISRSIRGLTAEALIAILMG